MAQFWIDSDPRFTWAHDMNSLLDAIQGNGPISGWAVSQDTGSDMKVSVAAGVGYVNGTYATTAAAQLVTITASDGTNDRYDVITMDSSGVESFIKCACPSSRDDPVRAQTGRVLSVLN